MDMEIVILTQVCTTITWLFSMINIIK